MVDQGWGAPTSWTKIDNIFYPQGLNETRCPASGTRWAQRSAGPAVRTTGESLPGPSALASAQRWRRPWGSAARAAARTCTPVNSRKMEAATSSLPQTQESLGSPGCWCFVSPVVHGGLA